MRMARPHRDTQEVVLHRIAAALAARDAIGPWTLAEIAPAAGLSPAGLIKRFGTRKGLLIALSRCWSAAIPHAPRGELPPLDELREWVHGRFTSDQFGAQGLGQLIDDLIDNDLRTLLAAGWSREQAYLASLLEAADLPGVNDPGTCAAILFDALNGAALRRAADCGHGPVTGNLDKLLEMWT